MTCRLFYEIEANWRVSRLLADLKPDFKIAVGLGPLGPHGGQTIALANKRQIHFCKCCRLPNLAARTCPAVAASSRSPLQIPKNTHILARVVRRKNSWFSLCWRRPQALGKSLTSGADAFCPSGHWPQFRSRRKSALKY